jgi:hypothetical protein
LGHTALEETLNEALLAAGERLAEAMRTGLLNQGLPADLCVFIEGRRVVVGSRSAAVRNGEMGTPSFPPKAVLEWSARDATPALLQDIAARLQGMYS